MAAPWEKYRGGPSGARANGPIVGPAAPVDPYKIRDQQIQEKKEARDAQKDAITTQKDIIDLKERTKKFEDGDVATAVGEERKAAAFLIRALGANDSYEGIGIGPRSLVGQGLADTVPSVLNVLPGFIGNSQDRQVSDTNQDEFIAASLRQDSGAAIPEEEMERQRRIYFPMPGDGEDVIEAKRQARIRAIEGLKQSSGKLLDETIARYQGIATNNPDPANAASAGVDESTNIIDPNAPITPRGPNYQAGPVESYVTDEDRARSEKMQEAYNKGAGPAELNRLASELGMQPFPADTMRTLMEARQRGQQVSIAPFASGQQGMIEKAVSTVADSPAGAYGIGAANALTLGGLDEVAGLVGGEGAGERAQFAKDYSRENSPIASMVGEVAGIGALSAIPGVAPAMTSVRGGATLGGIYGGLDTNENRLLGAGIGAVTGGVVNKYAPQATNALAQASAPAITRGKNVMNALAQNLPGAQTRATARQEVAQNADVIAAGQAENIPVRQPDVRPSLRDQYGGAEASLYGGPKIQKAASEDAQAIANRLAEVGGGGTAKQGYNLGEATQNAVSAEKSAMSSDAAAMYRRVELQAPGFKAPAFEASKAVGEKIDAIKKLTPEGNEGQIAFLQKLENNLTSTGVSVESLQANRDLIRSKMKADNLSFTKAEADLIDVVNAAARDLEKGLQDSGNTAALQSLKRANAKWSEYADFKRDVVKTIVGTKNQPVQPEMAAQRLLAMVSSNGSSEKFAKIYKALPVDEKAGFKALIAESLGKNARGDFSLALLAKGLDQKNINYKSLREVFTPDEFQSLMNLRRLADAKDKAMSGRNFSNTARAANNAPTGFGAFVRGALGFSVGDVAGATAAVAGPSIAERIGTKRTVNMLLNTDFSKWLANMPNTANPRAIDAYLKKLDRIKAPAVASNVVIFKDYLRQAATQSPGKLAASEQEGDGRPIPPQQ